MYNLNLLGGLKVLSNDLQKLFSLKGKTALVTGGGTGLGRIMTETMVNAGAKLLICSRKLANVKQAADEINDSYDKKAVQPFEGDLSSEDGIDQIFKEVRSRTETLNILINNSGATWGEKLGKFPYSAWGKVLDVNITGLFHLTQALLDMLEKSATHDNPSRIINLGSVMGSAPHGDGPYSYSASKAAVHHITRILAKELGPKNITVNAFAPGPFESKMTKFAFSTEEKERAMAKNIPLRRTGRHKDIAAATLYLCGSGGGYVTGTIIPLDGGIHVDTGPELFEAAKTN